MSLGKARSVNNVGSLAKKSLSSWPVDATIGNGNAVLELAERFGKRLFPGFQVALNHDCMNGFRPLEYLTEDGL